MLQASRAGTRLFSGCRNPALETPGYYQMFLRNINREAVLLFLLTWIRAVELTALARKLLHELHHFPLCPASVVAVAVRFADEGTMPAVRSLDVGKIGISRDLS